MDRLGFVDFSQALSTVFMLRPFFSIFISFFFIFSHFFQFFQCFSTFSLFSPIFPVFSTFSRFSHFSSIFFEYLVNVRINDLSRRISEYKKAHDVAANDISAYVSNPINAYLMTKRLTSDWQDIEHAMTKDIASGAYRSSSNQSNSKYAN